MLHLVAKTNLSSSSLILHHPHIFGCLPRSSSSSASPIQIPAASDDPKPLNFMADHLITTWGFTPDKAATISKRLLHLKSPSNPDAVLRFLTTHGFTDPQIKTLISWRPKLLLTSPENTLAPNLLALRDLGLSPSALTHLLLSGPDLLLLRSAVPRIKFWRDFLQDDHDALVRAFKQNRSLVSHDIARNIAPKVSLLQTHGFSAHQIRRIVLLVPGFITSSVGTMENLLGRARDLGFRPESGNMFAIGLHAVTRVTGELLQKKLEILKSFGWSEDQVFSALRKAPATITLSEENLRAKMEFLVGEVRYDPAYVATRPELLAYSLEKRLRPRHHVLNLLQSKGVSRHRQGFASATTLSDRKFVERCIVPHEKEIAGLHEAYLAACASGSKSAFGMLNDA